VRSHDPKARISDIYETRLNVCKVRQAGKATEPLKNMDKKIHPTPLRSGFHHYQKSNSTFTSWKHIPRTNNKIKKAL